MLFFFVWTDHLPGWMQDRSCFPLLRIEHYVQMPRYVGQGCPDNKCRRSTPLSGCPLCVSKTNNRERKKGDSQTTGNVREFHLNRMTHQQQIPHINTGNSLTPPKKSLCASDDPTNPFLDACPPAPPFFFVSVYVCMRPPTSTVPFHDPAACKGDAITSLFCGFALMSPHNASAYDMYTRDPLSIEEAIATDCSFTK